MAYGFRFRTTRAISTWPQRPPMPHSSVATAERSLKNLCFFSCHTKLFCCVTCAARTGTAGQQSQRHSGPLHLLLFSMAGASYIEKWFKTSQGL